MVDKFAAASSSRRRHRPRDLDGASSIDVAAD